MLAAFWTGTALGFVVAAQVGPVWLLCARTTLRVGVASGFGIGLGAAIVDLLYAALGAAGVAPLLAVPALRLALGLLGGVVLVVIGARTLRTAFRVRLGAETPEETVSARAALRTGLVATASNPMTIASWAAIFGAASAGGWTGRPPRRCWWRAWASGASRGTRCWWAECGCCGPVWGTGRCVSWTVSRAARSFSAVWRSACGRCARRSPTTTQR